MARPGYPCYRNVLTALGIEVVEIPTGPETRFQPTVEQVAALHEAQPITGLVVASPANPTGTMLLPQELAALALWCEEHHVQLVSDEIYHGIEYAPLDGTRADGKVRLGDQPRGGRVRQLQQVLLDDRLADRLDAGARPAPPGRRRADRQLHDLPAGDRAAGLSRGVRPGVVRRSWTGT